MMAEDLKPVRVRYRSLDYITEGTNPLGDTVDVIRTAYGPGMSPNNPANDPNLDRESQEYQDKLDDYQHGELVMLRPHQYVGLIKSGAVRDVQTDESGEEIVEEDVELLDVSTASVDDLVDWIRTERPTVQDVVDASGGDGDVARKLLEAEGIASDGEPRKGVLEGLTAVISRAD